MTTLRWILAFPVAVASWMFFPFILGSIAMAVENMLGTHILDPASRAGYSELKNTSEVAILFGLSPIVAIAILVLILPTRNRSVLVASTTAFSVISVIGALLVGLFAALGDSEDAFTVLISMPIGSIVGAILAYSCLPLKTADTPKEDRDDTTIFRWVLAFPAAVASWVFFPYIFMAALSFFFGEGGAIQEITFSLGCFLKPIISLGVLVLMLPPGNRSWLIKSIIIYSLFCAIGSVREPFGPILSLLSPQVLELAGTAVGAVLAYGYIPLKSKGTLEAEVSSSD